MSMERWATFDCYGTLIDWDGGIGGELARLWPQADKELLLARYHHLEPMVQSDNPGLSYREVLGSTLGRLAEDQALDLPEDESDALARSLPGWQLFPDVREALERVAAGGWRLAILSNTDRDLIEASKAAIGIEFSETIVASEIGSYKPARKHWDEFFSRTGAPLDGHVHVAQSAFHDIATAQELKLRSIWINRRREPRSAEPTRELPDLTKLPETLGELVPG